MRWGRHILAAMIGATVLVVSIPASSAVSEADVKAAFLPRFARYVTWPPAAMPSGSNPYVLCVVGADPFGGGLDSAARAQSVDGRRIVVRHLDSATGAGDCHIAYVTGSRSQSVSQILAALRGKPILTVTDARNGGQRGIIHFSVIDGRVRFYIDEAEASSDGISISSRLLALAVGVKQR
ncbi:MAG: YfiR family protein [Sphingomicrobium sp.]